jgi:hypothetical protein
MPTDKEVLDAAVETLTVELERTPDIRAKARIEEELARVLRKIDVLTNGS